MGNGTFNINSSAATFTCTNTTWPVITIRDVVRNVWRSSLGKMGLSDQKYVEIIIGNELAEFAKFRPKSVCIPDADGERFQVIVWERTSKKEKLDGELSLSREPS